MKSRGFLFLVSVVGLLALTGCGGGSTPTASLEVIINAPAGVTPKVRLQGPQTDQFISATGSTKLSHKTPGTYTLTPQDVDANNYTYGADASSLEVKAGDNSATVNYAAKTGRLKVNVSVEGGASPIAVEVRQGTTVLQTITTTDGPFVSLPPGAYTVVPTIKPLNYAAAVDVPGGVVNVQAGKDATVNVSFASGFGSAAVTLNAPAGITPNVTLTGPSNYTRIFTATGTSNIDNLIEGSYTLTPVSVLSAGIDYGAAVTTFTITKGQTTSSSLSYAATNSTIVVNVSGLSRPTDPVKVTLTPQPTGISPISSNGNGSVRFDRVPFGNYQVSASTTAVAVGNFIDSSQTAPSGSAITNLSSTAQSVNIVFATNQNPKVYLSGNGLLSNGGWGTSNSGAPTVNPPGSTSGADNGYSIADSSLASATPSSTTVTGVNLPATGLARFAFDRQGNLYAVYQYVANPAGGVALSVPQILRIPKANVAAGTLVPDKTIVATSAVSGQAYEITDIAFDQANNLWIANAGLTFTCVQASKLIAAADINNPDQTLSLPVGATALTKYGDVRSISFDPAGNLWFVSGNYLPGYGAAPVQLARLSRIRQATLSCGADKQLDNTDVTVRLSISNTDSPTTNTSSDGGPVFQPYGMALSPDGSALWIADYGAGSDITGIGNAACPSGSIQTNGNRESVIKVGLSGSNLLDNTAAQTVKNATISSRITIGAADTTNLAKGMQQATDVAFDSHSNLWVVTNNNMEIDPNNPCYDTGVIGGIGRTVVNASGGIFAGPISNIATDRFGKAYIIALGDLVDRNTATMAAVTPLKTISTPTTGVGLTGIAFDKPLP